MTKGVPTFSTKIKVDDLVDEGMVEEKKWVRGKMKAFIALI